MVLPVRPASVSRSCASWTSIPTTSGMVTRLPSSSSSDGSSQSSAGRSRCAEVQSMIRFQVGAATEDP